MRAAYTNFDALVCFNQNKPEFVALGILKEAQMALFTFRLGLLQDTRFAIEFFTDYSEVVLNRLPNHKSFSNILITAFSTMRNITWKTKNLIKLRQFLSCLPNC